MKMMLVFALLAAVVVYAQAHEEERLLADLLEGYHETRRFARPVANSSDVVTVDLGIILLRLADFKPQGGVNSGYGTLAANGWLFKRWSDVHLGWDPELYGGINELVIPHEAMKRFWSPNIVPWDGSATSDMQEVESLLFSDGRIRHYQPILFHLDCTPHSSLNYTICQIRIGTWAHDANHVDIGESPRLDVQGLRVHPEWRVIHGVASSHRVKYPCCDVPYASMTATLHLARTNGPFQGMGHGDEHAGDGDGGEDGDDSHNDGSEEGEGSRGNGSEAGAGSHSNGSEEGDGSHGDDSE